MKNKRGDIKRFREFLNNEAIAAPKHRHNRYHQVSRNYGDYLYHQDREKFMVDMADWLIKAEPPKPLAVIEVVFRGRWTPIYEVAEWKSERGWGMTLGEPVKQIRVRYL